ncbi:recombinase family protein [Paenibacillus xerothermodurans]|uniref:recombinase family protein n=1 Tax=Paenibacillus xerothermodurans TaxID=1977292 RepID=UPI001FB4C500|nr:recombinase family protein [Paenibacillus xerothermodurans]
MRTQSKESAVRVHPRTVAIYCRVSTDEQAREGISLDEQQARLLAYCRAMGWEAQPIVYVDDGYSAKNTDRPALRRLLGAVREGLVSKIMVTKLDRLSRTLLDLLTLIDLFQTHHVSFISTSEAFDTETPSGRLTLQVLGAVAEFERERIRERVLDNMFHAAKNGKWLTQAPYGYRLDNKNLVIFEPEAHVVRSVFQLFLEQGLGYHTIAKRLNEQAIPSRHNKEWSIRSVKLLLSNPVYKGTLVWNRLDSSKGRRQERNMDDWVIIPDCLPSIVEPSVWEHVQRKMQRAKPAPRAQTSPHLLGGILKCGECGGAMSVGWSGWPKRKRVYRCAANKNKGTCTGKSYRAEDIERWFMHGLSQISHTLISGYSAAIVPADGAVKQSNVRRQSQQVQQKYKRKVEAYAAGLIELSELTEAKEKLDKEMASLSSEQLGDPQQPDSAHLQQLESACKSELTTIVEALNALPVVEAKALIRTLVDRVTVLGIGELAIWFTSDGI